LRLLLKAKAGEAGKRWLGDWGCGEVLALPESMATDNPLLAVMWARFQEGCRLLWALGMTS
jgi:hypothetical protein